MIKKDLIKYAIHLISYSLMWFFAGMIWFASKDYKTTIFIVWMIFAIISFATTFAGWSIPKKGK